MAVQKEEANTSVAVNDKDQKQAVGAGVAVGLCGILLGGPIIGTALGLVAGYAAKQDQGVVGESARKVGNFAVHQQERLAEVEGKHHYMEKTNKFLWSLWEKTVNKVNECLLFVAPGNDKKD